MTSCGPYSEATLIYEPIEKTVIASVAAPGSVLEVIATEYPNWLKLIERANLTRLYDGYPCTVFVCANYLFNESLPIATAYEMCRSSTLSRKIDARSLLCATLILNTMSPQNNLLITKNNTRVMVNGANIIATIDCNESIVHVTDQTIW
jgi:hypothetical protein